MTSKTLEAAEIMRMMALALPRLTDRSVLGADELPLMRTLINAIVRGQPARLRLYSFSVASERSDVRRRLLQGDLMKEDYHRFPSGTGPSVHKKALWLLL